jgi:Bacteriophage HK97-gp10, putative tail-component
MVSQNYIVRLKQVTKLTGLQSEIMKQLNQYSKIVNEDVQQAQQETATELVDTLRTKSPELTGSYQSGWRIKKEKKKLIIHNKTDYQLTHLLEHGHAKKNGGRVEAQIHIRPAEVAAIQNYLQKIEQAIKQ